MKNLRWKLLALLLSGLLLFLFFGLFLYMKVGVRESGIKRLGEVSGVVEEQFWMDFNGCEAYLYTLKTADGKSYSLKENIDYAQDERVPIQDGTSYQLIQTDEQYVLSSTGEIAPSHRRGSSSGPYGWLSLVFGILFFVLLKTLDS